jgi:hypothetical protein
MSDTNSAGQLPVTQAPSAIPMNIASLSRLALALLGGWLIQNGYADNSTWPQYAGLIILIATAAWNMIKNQNVVKNIVGALQAPAHTVVSPITGATLPPAVPVAALMLALFLAPSLMLMGCTTPVINTPAATVTSLKVVYGFEATYNTAGNLYLIWAPGKTDAQKAPVKAILAKAYQAVQAAETAERLGQTDTLAGQVTLLEMLAAQATALISANP